MINVSIGSHLISLSTFFKVNYNKMGKPKTIKRVGKIKNNYFMKKEEKKGRLTLEDFKTKSGHVTTKKALESISGGVLDSCHDASTGGGGGAPSCRVYRPQN